MEGEKRRYEQMCPAVRLASASGWPRPPRRPPLPVRAQPPVAAAGLAPRAALVTAPISSSLLHHLPLTENERRSKFDGRTSFPSLSVVISTGGTLSPSTLLSLTTGAAFCPPTASSLVSSSFLSLLRARACFFAF